MSVTNSDSQYTNPDALRLLYLNPKNPLGGLGEANPVEAVVPVPEVPVPINPPPGQNCPALGQFILIRLSEKGGIHYKKVEEIKVFEDYAWNPLTKSFHQIIKADIIKSQACARVRSSAGAETVCTLSEPLIQSFEDNEGTMVFDLVRNPDRSHKIIETIDFQTKESEIHSIANAGFLDVVHISLADGFIYTCGSDPLKTIARHNKPPRDEIEIVE